MADTDNADIKKLTFERAIEELETIVKRLEEGKVPLEESVAIYERGEVLEAPLRGIAAPGRGAGREDHAGRLRQAGRHRASGHELAAIGPVNLRTSGRTSGRFDLPLVAATRNHSADQALSSKDWLNLQGFQSTLRPLMSGAPSGREPRLEVPSFQ